MEPLPEALSRAAASENFTVASRLLPARYRRDLLAVYDFARTVDDLGDEADGDRLALLDRAEAELDRALQGAPAGAVFASVAHTVRRAGLDPADLRRLIEANRIDQRRTSYDTFTELLDYCSYSAAPVGRLVLGVFGVDDPEAGRLSDDVCAGLQVTEHLQDVAEDARAGRVYLPADDLAAFGCRHDDLRAPSASVELRGLIAFESWRARRLLASAEPLMALLPGPARVAVAGFAGGGTAALDSIAACRFDVLGRPARPSPRRAARLALSLLAPSSPVRRGGGRGRH
ncbi:MAG TPA: squalene synthase HpnC [Acidimicrobiales bacterium]|nr:squalene synthase HpnC [Acidimicrobiales bacterium]